MCIHLPTPSRYPTLRYGVGRHILAGVVKIGGDGFVNAADTVDFELAGSMVAIFQGEGRLGEVRPGDCNIGKEEW